MDDANVEDSDKEPSVFETPESLPDELSIKSRNNTDETSDTKHGIKLFSSWLDRKSTGSDGKRAESEEFEEISVSAIECVQTDFDNMGNVCDKDNSNPTGIKQDPVVKNKKLGSVNVSAKLECNVEDKDTSSIRNVHQLKDISEEITETEDSVEETEDERSELSLDPACGDEVSILEIFKIFTWLFSFLVEHCFYVIPI